MSLSLSAADLARLSRAMQLLLSPLDHGDADRWRSRVNGSLKELLGADAAGFHLPGTGGALFYTDDYTVEELDAHEDVAPPPLPDGTSMVERGLELEVSTLERAYGPHVERYHHSTYYNEYSAQIGKYDTLFTLCRLSGPEPDAVASLQLFHERPTGRRFGERELSLLRLLFPAFQAGAEAYVRWGAQRRELLGLLDRAGAAARVLDARQRIVHQTPALSAMLAAEPEAEPLHEALRRVGEAVGRVAQGHAPAPGEPAAAIREVCTGSARYRVRGCLHEEAGSGALVLLALERLTAQPLSEEELRERFQLTAAEARVALRLARGCSNAQIAEELRVSPHTVRRHTERVFTKLGVRSRSEVAGRVHR